MIVEAKVLKALSRRLQAEDVMAANIRFFGRDGRLLLARELPDLLVEIDLGPASCSSNAMLRRMSVERLAGQGGIQHVQVGEDGQVAFVAPSAPDTPIPSSGLGHPTSAQPPSSHPGYFVPIGHVPCAELIVGLQRVCLMPTPGTHVTISRNGILADGPKHRAFYKFPKSDTPDFRFGLSRDTLVDLLSLHPPPNSTHTEISVDVDRRRISWSFGSARIVISCQKLPVESEGGRSLQLPPSPGEAGERLIHYEKIALAAIAGADTWWRDHAGHVALGVNRKRMETSDRYVAVQFHGIQLASQTSLDIDPLLEMIFRKGFAGTYIDVAFFEASNSSTTMLISDETGNCAVSLNRFPDIDPNKVITHVGNL